MTLSNESSERTVEEDVDHVDKDERRLAEDVERLERDVEGRKQEVTVEVNSTAVVLSEHLVTGLQLKQAAIDQGATLEIDFQLWRLTGEHKRDQVANDEKVHLHDGERFAATASDDNA
jgi:hypothetical protein